MSHPSTHPSIVYIGVAPAPVRSYPLGHDRLDAAYGDRGAVRSGELTIIQGVPKSGRTARLVQVATNVANLCAHDDHGVVLVATVDDRPELVLSRLCRSLDGHVVESRIRVARVTTSSELALFVAQVIESGLTPAALFVDDLGLIDYDYGTSSHTGGAADTAGILSLLSRGRVADAVRVGTNLPFGAFQLSSTSANTTPFAVVATLRGSRDGRFARHSAVAHASVVIDVDDQVLKSRIVLRDVEQPTS